MRPNQTGQHMSETIKSFKGFDSNWQCRGFQYEVGKTYTHEGPVEACGSGFHACEHPLNVFAYYPPSGSKFAEVEQSGDLSRHGDDSKVASRHISIKAELSIAGLVSTAIEYVTSRCEPINPESPASATGDHGAASATGDHGAASATGYQGAASATGYQGAASATGTRGAASATGYQGTASATGYQGAASATGTRGVASATGYQGTASATGGHGAASATGTRGAASATGPMSVALASGYEGRALGIEGGAIFLVRRDLNDNITHVFASKVGESGIKPNVWYLLDETGSPKEVA